MLDIIQLLPDNVANQIAAGEVIQRPSSVVKELVENALDSGANEIKIIIRDAGRTLIQVVDNGCGMSETDARLAFERHATSKIRKAEDLFSIHTMGFRGEALASIASVAQVELKTTLNNKETGTHIIIEGSKVISQEVTRCPVGANFIVKNLFYNIPARRKFLKSNNVELRHITSEIQHIALINPNIKFIFIHNDVEILNMQAEMQLQRIVSIFGQKMKKNLIRIEVETSLVSISGYIGVLGSVRKTKGEQFFFVNNRFMRHPYLHKAVMQAYDQLIPSDSYPPYFIHLKVDPSTIDINIHPTKTEIKFEEEAGIWPILASVVREALGKSNAIPSIDFDQADSVEFPLYNEKNEVYSPTIQWNTSYNPFLEKEQSYSNPCSKPEILIPSILNDEVDNDNKQIEESLLYNDMAISESNKEFFQYKTKYILTSSRSGLMLIDQHRAHYRVLYEYYLKMLENQHKISHKLLFPETLEVTPEERKLLLEYMDDFNFLGFELNNEPEKDSFQIEGVPADLQNKNPIQLLEQVLDTLKQDESSLRDDAQKSIAKSFARVAAIKMGQILTVEEMSNLFNQLFACEVQIFSPDGKSIISIIDNQYIEQQFK